jgi:hypothetical protein
MAATSKPTSAERAPPRAGVFATRAGTLAAVIIAACTLSSAACGPVTTASTIGDAVRDLQEADSLDAARRAPYEYTRARELLAKAKELEGYGAFELASAYARQSHTMSEKALDVARLAAEREKRDERFGPKKRADDSSAPDDPGTAPSSGGR